MMKKCKHKINLVIMMKYGNSKKIKKNGLGEKEKEKKKTKKLKKN